jgi:hypothetical protein
MKPPSSTNVDRILIAVWGVWSAAICAIATLPMFLPHSASSQSNPWGALGPLLGFAVMGYVLAIAGCVLAAIVGSRLRKREVWKPTAGLWAAVAFGSVLLGLAAGLLIASAAWGLHSHAIVNEPLSWKIQHALWLSFLWCLVAAGAALLGWFGGYSVSQARSEVAAYRKSVAGWLAHDEPATQLASVVLASLIALFIAELRLTLLSIPVYLVFGGSPFSASAGAGVIMLASVQVGGGLGWLFVLAYVLWPTSLFARRREARANAHGPVREAASDPFSRSSERWVFTNDGVLMWVGGVIGAMAFFVVLIQNHAP